MFLGFWIILVSFVPICIERNAHPRLNVSFKTSYLFCGTSAYQIYWLYICIHNRNLSTSRNYKENCLKMFVCCKILTPEPYQTYPVIFNPFLWIWDSTGYHFSLSWRTFFSTAHSAGSLVLDFPGCLIWKYLYFSPYIWRMIILDIKFWVDNLLFPAL